ncbi:MAG TPA: flagellar hook-length control protein FliK [Candidatus Acidoferrales bacterium]
MPTLISVPIPATPISLVMQFTNGTDANADDPTGAKGTSKTASPAGTTLAGQSGSATSASNSTNALDSSAAEAIDFDELVEAAASDDASQDTDAAMRTQTQTPPLAPDSAPQHQQDIAVPNDARSSQFPATPASRLPQPIDQIQFQLPSTATFISATTGPSEPASSHAESTTQARQPIAPRMRSGLPSLDSASQTTAAQPLQSLLEANNNGPGNGNSNGSPNGFASQYGNHQPAQSSSQSSDTSHSSNDTKSSAASESSQSARQSNAIAVTQANVAATATLSDASAPAVSSVHASAQVAAQADTATATASTKETPFPVASANQSAPLAPALPPTLSRSLTDVSQATQLYQRLGGGEMHIAMNTDLLGLIDLRAVVHQGSLSATIGVQHSDIQTLLVNELPALQHSLSEKNLQVGQISVLAGSIGSGANPNNQPRQDHQNRQSPSPAPAFRDTASPVILLAASATSAATLVAGNSARLSVLA